MGFTMTKELTASMEDYLEIIYLLVKKNKLARAKDIATHLGVKKPSVTGALRVLSDKGLVRYTPYGYIDLTAEGEKQASKIFRRHEILRNFFENVLQIKSELAEEDACKIEHSISDATLERLVDFVHFIEECPRAGESWVKAFNDFCIKNPDRTACKNCTEEMLENFVKTKRTKKKLKVIKNAN